MSREIKFRAWYDQTNSMIPWERLTSEYTADSIFNVPKQYDLKVMQFTGLKDKNGNEIYEGDIMRGDKTRNIREVKWQEDGAAFYTEQPAGWPAIEKGEIIGNIYENPELLEPPLGNGAEPIRNLPEDDWRKDDR